MFAATRRSSSGELGRDAAELAAFTSTDWIGLDLAARSYAYKRGARKPRY